MAPRVGSVELPGEPPKGHGRIRRNYKSPDKLVESPEPGVDTLLDVVERGARLHPNKNSLGWRDQIKVHEEEKEITTTVKGKETKTMKKWQTYEMGPYQYYTYKQVHEIATKIGAGLRHLGIDKDKMFNICSSTKAEWLLMAFGAASQSITFATAYDSLGEEGLQHSINEPEVVGMFTNSAMLPTLAKTVPKTKTLKLVIYDGKPNEKEQGAIKEIGEYNKGQIKIITYQELLKLGGDHPTEPTRPSPETPACVMYTSGSTGAPKGVIMTHRNITASIGAVCMHLGDLIKPGMTFIAYLPLAHILELVVECSMFYIGVTMGYGTVKTLTDTSVKNCAGDIREFKPSVMVGVPAVWELIRKGIVSKVGASGFKSQLFNAALKAKRSSPSVLGPIADAVVFKAVKQATGGRLQFALSGGAAISRETQDFLNTALVTLLQGYGLTESCGMCAVLHPDYYGYGTVGLPMPSVEVKLVDVEDAKYFVSNNPPQGEIWIRGNSVFKGYYKRDDITKESVTDDGWFMTGDIGQWNPDGTLSLIDRKKNLVKLSGGEYVALERLESTYKSCNIVANICVHASSDAKQPMAIVFPHEANFKKLAADQGWGSSNEDFESLCQNEKAADAMTKAINDVGKKAGFKNLELLQCTVLTGKEWTPQNGLLTPAQKLQRKAIMEEYDDQVKKVYP